MNFECIFRNLKILTCKECTFNFNFDILFNLKVVNNVFGMNCYIFINIIK